MLYGGPLGAYLSRAPASSSSSGSSVSSAHSSHLTPLSRHSSLRGPSSGSSGSTYSRSSTGSSFYTPQTSRRKIYGSTDSVASTDSGRASSLYGGTSLENVRSSNSHDSLGTSSRNNSYQMGLDRLHHRKNSSEDTDWKKLYEKEKMENDRLRRELERKTSEAEEQHKRVEKSLSEIEKLRAENRALARVVARLSREK